MNRNTFHPSSRSARRHVLAAVAATVLGLGALHSTAALAQAPAYPTKTITFVVPFAAGSATLTPDAMKKLDQVAKALADRPALKMTVVGHASMEAEHDALKRARLMRMLRAEKRRTAIQSTGTPPKSFTTSLIAPLLYWTRK